MRELTVRTVETMREFVDWVDSLEWPKISGGFAFRGQAKSKWRLRASYYRLVKLVNMSRALAHQIERETLSRFRQGAGAHLAREGLLRDNMHVTIWWALMQHYGGVTRVLDWTGSPYVAAYFAVEKCWKCDGAVWFVDKVGLLPGGAKDGGCEWVSRVQQFQRDVLVEGEDKRVLLYQLMKAPTDRMVAQQSYYLCAADLFKDFEEIFEKVLGEEEMGSKYGKLVIPQNKKDKFLHELRKMNITAQSLFPGLDGAGRAVTEFVRVASAPINMELLRKMEEELGG